MATDRLSAFPDRVLQCVVSHLSVSDAVRTSLLSLRWRTLWRQGDAVNLDSEDYDDGDDDGVRAGRELFRDALAAVGADGRRPVRRLSIVVFSGFQRDFVRGIMRTTPGMDAILATPAIKRLEELRLDLSSEFCPAYDVYTLPASRVPCWSLRLLELKGCTLGPRGAAAPFGRLETLKLVSCKSSLEGLQAMLDGAPNLVGLWLEHVIFTAEELGSDWHAVMSKRRLLLCCPHATVSVTVMHCHRTGGLDIDAPSVRSLRYTGLLEHFPFSSATPKYPSGETPPHALFWESIGRFSRLRVLKLVLLDINDIAVRSEEEDVFLKVFPDLKFLELQGSLEVHSHGAAVAIANLLLCCPAIQEFHLKCKLHGDLYSSFKRTMPQSDEKKSPVGPRKIHRITQEA
ncbi:hypothetical protein BAE44_0024492 [Dichanthelium oligosanthes]|uniref:F-box domain-containing protein n=1 Tax=Dichanthelium oligosanthes TaxID=888268 RepID=A0A1E5UNU5_9POAL|nr:hypothetical protein BAE44_0024492 [Dichanthelium oligosanthes]